MRQLLFRVWDTKKKEWAIPEMNFIGEFSVIGGGLSSMLRPYGIMDLNDLVVSQYIGIDDCKKKKIFEGDILDVILHDGTKERCTVKYDEPNALFYMEHLYETDGTQQSGFYEDWFADLKVVGNIFDSPKRVINKNYKSAPKGERHGKRVSV